MTRRHRRLPILRLLLVLAAGAMVNVGVAWATCVWPPRVEPRFVDDPEFDVVSWWRDRAPSGFAREPTSVGPEVHYRRGVATAADAVGPLGGQGVIVERTGWPALSMASAMWSREDVGGVVRVDDGVLRLPEGLLRRGQASQVPLVPLWPGFAVNALLYTTVVWLAFWLAPSSLRRWRRARRGLCPTCAYPVGASTVCSECGCPRVGGI